MTNPTSGKNTGQATLAALHVDEEIESMIHLEAAPTRIAVASTLDANSFPDADDYYETITKVIPSHEQAGDDIIRSHVLDALHINDTEDPSIMTSSIPGL